MLREHGVNPDNYTDQYITEVVGLVKNRINFVKDLWDQTSYFFTAPETYSEKDIKKRWKPETPEQLEQLAQLLDALPQFDGPDT